MRGSFFNRRRLGRTGAGLLGAAALGFWLGQGAPVTTTFAQPPAQPAPAPGAPSDYSQSVVAYITDNGHQVPITREELGEFLIARYGAEKLELLVNKRIIETACKQQGVTVTDAEVEAAFQQDCEGLHVNKKDFIEQVLKRYDKTLYEWKEDVLKPRLLLGKLCQRALAVEDDDLRKMFENKYGEKVKCRIILYPPGAEYVKFASEEYKEVRKGEEEFKRAARKQANPSLAAREGEIMPIGHYGADKDDTIEKAAFQLQPGDVSALLPVKEGMVVIRCEGRVPPDATKNFAAERENLRREVAEKKVTQMIPEVFGRMRQQANPTLILRKATTDEELRSMAEKELREAGLQPTGATVPAPAGPPGGR
jgi:parvulin-like peptidyl-prolyl isomerase